MWLRTAVPLAAGAALFVWLIALYDPAAVLGAVAGLGWGLALVVAVHLPPLLADTESWRRLMPPAARLRFGPALFARWCSESVNVVVPGGGELVRLRLVVLRGMPARIAGASLIADITVGVLTQAVFAFAGLAAFFAVTQGMANELGLGLSLGATLFAVVVVAFFLAQRAGLLHGLAQLVARHTAGPGWVRLIGGASALDGDLRATYDRRRDLVRAALWRLGSWTLGAAEYWLALHLLGHPVTLAEAVALEALTQVVRTAVFFVPAGLGVQEGGLVLLGQALGIPAEIALALSLVKRVREWSLGAPGLLAWQAVEGGRLLRRRGDRSR